MDNSRCNGCHDVNSHTHECSFCHDPFGIECDCIEINVKETDLDLCLNCQDDPKTPDRIIAHMVEQLDIEQKESAHHRRTAKIYQDGYNKYKELVRNSITV